jgi:hypothetical protein
MIRVLAILTAVVALAVSAHPASAGTPNTRLELSSEATAGSGRPGGARVAISLGGGTNLKPWTVTHQRSSGTYPR